MKESTAGTIAGLFGILTFGILLFVASAITQEKLYKQVSTGEVQFWDEVYTCEFKGKYVDEKRFIPSTVTMEDLPKEILQIEQWSGLKHTETIFDSMKDDWKKGSSTFDSVIKGKEKLIFFIETTDGISIGGVVKARIVQHFQLSLPMR